MHIVCAFALCFVFVHGYVSTHSDCVCVQFKCVPMFDCMNVSVDIFFTLHYCTLSHDSTYIVSLMPDWMNCVCVCVCMSAYLLAETNMHRTQFHRVLESVQVCKCKYKSSAIKSNRGLNFIHPIIPFRSSASNRKLILNSIHVLMYLSRSDFACYCYLSWTVDDVLLLSLFLLFLSLFNFYLA